jgi:hypothetical protein
LIDQDAGWPRAEADGVGQADAGCIAQRGPRPVSAPPDLDDAMT